MPRYNAGISPKQKAFAERWVATGNATQAVKEVYNVTSEDSAKSLGSENLAKENVIAYIKQIAPTAAKVVHDLMLFSENDTVRLNASKDMLDRAGFKPIERAEVLQHTDVSITDEQLEAILSDYVKRTKVNND